MRPVGSPQAATEAGVGWDWGAFIALLAALAAAGPVVVPAVRAFLDSRKAAGGPRSY